jgi:tetratricopeptide (TPR) repeat protein
MTHLLIAFALLQDADAEKRAAAAKEIQDQAFVALKAAGDAQGDEKKKAYEEAVGHFRRIVKDYADTPSYGISHFNCGVILCDYLSKPEDAIKEFLALIASNVNDKDDTGQLMSPYRNYRYHSWRMISKCRSELKQPVQAADATIQSRKAYISDCGTCSASMEKSALERLVSIATGISDTATEEDVAEVLKTSPASGAKLVLDLGKRLNGSKRDGKPLLKVLADELPKTDEGKEAAGLLKETKK